MTAVQARSLGIKGSVLARLTQRGNLGSREFEIRAPENAIGRGLLSTRTQGEQNVPAVLPAVGLSCNDFQ